MLNLYCSINGVHHRISECKSSDMKRHLLVVDGSTKFIVEHEIKSISLGDLIIVLTYYYYGQDASMQPLNNIVALDYYGNFLWSIREFINEDELYTGAVIYTKDQAISIGLLKEEPIIKSLKENCQYLFFTSFAEIVRIMDLEYNKIVFKKRI